MVQKSEKGREEERLGERIEEPRDFSKRKGEGSGEFSRNEFATLDRPRFQERTNMSDFSFSESVFLVLLKSFSFGQYSKTID